jgi:hypothetical protein
MPIDAESDKQSRFQHSEEAGKPIDFATMRLPCTCGKSDCWTNGLLPLRSHIAALFRAIVSLGFDERFPGFERQDDPWPGVIYALSMAGGLTDLSADPTFVNDDESGLWCSSAWDHDEEDRALASQYTSGLVVFNFAWTAYEAAIEISAAGMHEKDKVPVRSRKLLQKESAAASEIRHLAVNYRLARRFCIREQSLKEQIEKTEAEYKLEPASAAAELVRAFRNHIVHGREALPAYDLQPCWRFYSVTRILLLLTQYLILRKISRPEDSVPLSVNQEELGAEPAERYLKNLHYDDLIWRSAGQIPLRFDGHPSIRDFGV